MEMVAAIPSRRHLVLLVKLSAVTTTKEFNTTVGAFVFFYSVIPNTQIGSGNWRLLVAVDIERMDFLCGFYDDRLPSNPCAFSLRKQHTHNTIRI